MSSFCIILVTVLIDFIEDYHKHIFTTIRYNFILILLSCLSLFKNFTFLFIIFFVLLINNIFFKQNKIIKPNTFTQLIKRITSFSLDSIFNSSLYNSNLKGLNLFVSIDNYLLETANHISFYKKLSYYLQKNLFNKFIIQININLVIIFYFIIFINFLLY